LTGLFGAVKVIACTFFIFFIAERFGRRTLLMSGALIMAACMLTVGLVDHFKAPPHKGVVTSAGKATVALIYLDIMVYNCS
jgi:MFS family permease